MVNGPGPRRVERVFNLQHNAHEFLGRREQDGGMCCRTSSKFQTLRTKTRMSSAFFLTQCELIHCHFPHSKFRGNAGRRVSTPKLSIMVQTEEDHLVTKGNLEGVGVTHQRKVGVGLLGARLEALEHVCDVDGKRNLPTPPRRAAGQLGKLVKKQFGQPWFDNCSCSCPSHGKFSQLGGRTRQGIVETAYSRLCTLAGKISEPTNSGENGGLAAAALETCSG